MSLTDIEMIKMPNGKYELKTHTALLEVAYLPYHKYLKIKPLYWVCYNPLVSETIWKRWTLSPVMPRSLYRGTQRWRNPTYEEAIIRQAVFQLSPEFFETIIAGQMIFATEEEIR